MINKIIELLGKLPEKIRGDLGLYVALGVILLTFVVALIVGLAASGELGKFRKCARGALKDASPQNINANMQKMPIKVKKQYKRAMMTGAKPSDIVSADAAYITPYSHSAISKLWLATAIGTVMGIAAGVGLSVVFDGIFGAAAGLIAVCGALLGGLLMIVSAVISSCVYRGARKAYESLVDALDGMSGGAGYTAPAHEDDSRREETVYSDYAQTQQNADAQTEYVQTEYAQPEYVRPEFEQTEYEQPHDDEESAERARQQQQYEQPVYEQPQYAQTEKEGTFVAEENTVVTQSVEDEAAQKARAREETLAQLRAEQAERIRRAQEAGGQTQENDPELEANRAASRAAAQKRLEELKQQREAQMRARAQAQAEARAEAQANGEPSVSAEDVIRRIENINKNGAPLAEMKEAALLLQQERKKPENQTPEQSKKLNEALSKLLKAMSAAQRK